ncbi:retinaldehyde-binding protein 1-like [Corticium candelabrum]|uniref:retinaldehyde-binding protein 1-like n=1 Tax=Corticium candelabrum TaxID=121492 RepID=UPI002E2589FC|nr:retinaldehyde-binding protein 1-like [Corticium candelabrum]
MEPIAVFPSQDKLHTLSTDATQKAANDLDETDETKPSSLTKLRQLLDTSLSTPDTKASLHLPDPDILTSDIFLTKFLRARNFDAEQAHRLILNYYTFQANHPFLFTDHNAVTLSPVFDAGIFAVLPNRDRQGRVVVLFFPGRHRLCEIPFDHMLRACVYVLERAVRSAETQVNGIVLLEDFDGFTLKQALGLKARDLKNLVTLAQDCFPVRLTAIHMVKQPKFITLIMSIIRPFLAADVRRKIIMHGTDFRSLHHEFEPSTLPFEFGGTTGPVDIQSSKQMLLDEQ